MNCGVDGYRRMRIFAVEGLDQTLTNRLAVFVVGLRQHDQQLRGTELGQDIALTKGIDADVLQVVHGVIQAAASQFLSVSAMKGEENDVDGIAGTDDGTGLDLI